MLEVSNENSVTIRDINNKTNTEKQSFQFNKVFDHFARQDSVFQYVLDHGIKKALEGTNCCVLSYGQTGAGKTYTTFGNNEKFAQNPINLYSDSQKDKKGLIPKTVEYLLKKNQEMEGVRELTLTCNFVEIYLDQVRDLSHNYSDQYGLGQARRGYGGNNTPFEDENLEIYEHANGQILIRNVRNVIIRSMEELYDLLASGFALRDKAESNGNQIWARAHTIFTINIVQKEVENEDLPFPKSMIQFVDLAGSERIAKSISEGQNKFQEAVLVMSHLTSLYKVLAALSVSSKSIPYRDSKLTQALYNCLNAYNNVILIAHLNPAESNFEETLNTLQYTERCKNSEQKDKRLGGNISGLGGLEESMLHGNAGNDKLWKKMNDEVNELKTKLENCQRDHKAKLERIQALLGVEIDLDKVTSNAISKEVQVLTQLKNTYLENHNLKLTITQMEDQFENMQREFEDERKEFFHKQSKNESKMVELRELLKRDTDKLKADSKKEEDDLKKQVQQLTAENKRLVESNTQLLQEKTHALVNFTTNLSSKTRDLNQTLDMKNIGKKEAELHFKEEMMRLKADHKAVAESLKEQYEQRLKAKNEEMDKFIEKAQEYKRRKQEQVEGMRNELLDLYAAFQKHDSALEKVETGAYSGGIKSFYVPSKDKGVSPTRQRYPFLYKALDEKLLGTTTRDFYRGQTEESFKFGGFDMTKKSTMQWATRTTNKLSMPLINTTTSALSRTLVKPELHNEVDLEVNLNKLQLEDLRRYCDNLKKLCRELKNREKELRDQSEKFFELNANSDIHQIMKERDRYKSMYKDEIKKNNENKLSETQKRFFKSVPKFNPSGTLRPTTSGYY